MTRAAHILVLSLFALLPACGGGDDPAPPTPRTVLGPVAFVAGCWQGAAGTEDGALEEHWTPADADVMLGTSRTFSGERVTGFEFMRIEATDDGIVYVPYPQGEQSVVFPLRESSPGRAVFENLRHDFPQRIVYARTPDGGLSVRVENARRGLDWTLDPEPCQS